MEDKQLPEAGAVAFFAYKRPDGFEISLTLRDESGTAVLNRINTAVEKVKAEGGLPVAKNSWGRKERQLDYIEGRVCPKCGNKLLNTTTKDGRKFIKCEMNKYDFVAKKPVGCLFVEWPESKESSSNTASLDDYTA